MAALLRGDGALRAAFASAPRAVTVEQLDALAARGRRVLDAFLPAESPPGRGADAALLFLIYPLEVVNRAQADAILDLVLGELEGEHGIKRYRGDSYWCAGYKELLGLTARTADFSNDIAARDALLVPGTEAEWCIFDPIVSVIHGIRYREGRRPEDLAAQIEHFNRALGQITADDFAIEGVPRGGLCPEAYYVAHAHGGVRIPNDHVPLAWTQANLATALAWMERSVE
jgi:phosphorylase kinase alpha/beta subunit